MIQCLLAAHARCTFRPRATNAVLFFVLSAALTLRADVFINEFVADNETGLRTAVGTFADWIELANNGATNVDVSGWYLTDSASTPGKWRIPDGTSIAANGYLLVFADSSPISFTNNELHANFSLSKDGEYLALIQPDGVTVSDAFAPRYPAQLPDISYGRGTLHEREIIGADAPFRYRIPNAAETAPWTNATGALGFTATNGIFTVRYYEMNAGILDIDAAEMMVTNSAYWNTDRSYPISAEFDTIDFLANSVSGNFTNDLPFPGHASPDEDRDNFVVVVDGSINVPSPGLWTFAVGSDDGFRLRIAGHGVNFVSEYTTGRSFETTLGTFNFPVAGIYSLQLVYFEASGAAGLELSAARDFQELFSLDAFRLIGDPACEISHAGLIGPFFENDLSFAMKNVNSRLDAEWVFELDQAPLADDVLTLSVRCVDGFSAALNGNPCASLNTPPLANWNSTATATRSPEQAGQWLSYVIPASLFTAGTNTLLITALNDTAADTEFLIDARLTWHAARSFPAYFKTPTPRSANGRAYTAPTPVVTASEPRGYRTSPFTVSLSCPNPNAEIRYTLNGSAPNATSRLYTGPLNVSATTTLRASVVDPESVRQNVTTVTWLFLEDILKQSTNPPSGWPANRQVNNHVIEYGMRQQIVASDAARLRNGMTNAIPSISLVTDLANLFNAQTGIYVNPGNDGITWERPVSVELIDPVKGPSAEFHIDAGVRIRGAYSRSSSNPKHAFRLFFRSGYGDTKLRFPLFQDEGASEFQKVDLRTSQNYSWSYENSGQETFVRETFSRDSQRDMGMPYTRSRYYHLFINGQYWGLYQTQERGDADYAQTYLGGTNDNWDCIKTSQPGYVTTPSDGNFTAFYAIHNLAVVQGFTGAYTNNYMRLKGLNPDGTPNPSYPAYLDEDNLIIYMLTAYYTGDPDSPVSMWGGFPNNMYGLFNRVTPDGFKWLRHDAEHSLGAHSGYPVTCDTTSGGSTFTDRAKFNPATLHLRLCQNAEYRRRFADLVQKHLYGNGALTPTNAQQRFRSRMNEIDLAIIAESARWGRGKTRDANWLPTCNSVLNNYLTQRRDIIVGIFRSHGWFPSMDAPAYSLINTVVPTNQPLHISAGTAFYYTTNGTDPRLPNGAVNPAAIAVTGTNQSIGPRTLVARGATWRYYDLGAEPPASGKLTWRDPGYPDNSWGQGPAIIGFAGSATANPVATVTRRYVNGVSAPQVTTTYLRGTFTLDRTNEVSNLLVDLLRDDGVVIYLNGVELFRDNMNAGAPTYSTYAAATVGSPDQNTYFNLSVNPGNLLRVGANTLAVELHQCNASSSDLYFDISLTIPGTTTKIYADLAVISDLTLKARAFSGTEWSALSENTLTLQRPPPDYTKLRVSELMYAPVPPPDGSPFLNDDFAWLELRNTGPYPLDLAGVAFTNGISHTFAPLTLAPHARMVLAKNPAAFATRYQTNNINLVAWADGNLARRGETLSLVDPRSTNVLTFTYSSLWYPETYTNGSSLVAVDLAAEEPLWSTAANWRPSTTPNGTPGLPQPPVFNSARLTADHHLTLQLFGLEDPVTLWVSEDLVTWQPCDPGAWSQNAGTVAVDLSHPSLPQGNRCFFQAQLAP